MIGRRAAIGLSLVCALAFCAFAAQSASAKGITAFTCAKSEKGSFDDAHCNKGNAKGTFGHTELKEGTAVTISNKNTANATTDHTMAIGHLIGFDGEKVTNTCTKAHGTGVIANTTHENGKEEKVMGVTGEINTFFTDCVVSGDLAKKDPSCKIKGGTVITEAEISTPTEEAIKFENKGGPLTSFTIEGCKNKAYNTEYTITGHSTAEFKGTTLITTEEGSKGLESGGEPAEITFTETLTMSTSEPGIAFTTDK